MLTRLLSLAAVLLMSDVALAQKLNPPPQGEVEIAKAQLKTLSTKLDAIRYPVERHRLGGWVVLNEQVKAVLETIDRNRGVGNDETSEAYKELVFQISISKDYFQSIETPGTAADIQAIQSMGEEIRALRKMDKNLFGRNTIRMFTRIRSLTEALKKFPISDKLRTGLQDLTPQIAAVLAVETAQRGDTWLTFEEGRKAVSSLRTLYPLFSEAGVDQQIFVTVSLINGITEQYAVIVSLALQQKVEDGRKP